MFWAVIAAIVGEESVTKKWSDNDWIFSPVGEFLLTDEGSA